MNSAQRFLSYQPHKLNRILESKLNSAKRSPELSVSLPELSKTLFTKAF
ncbi:hypothetical protein [Leptospira noguchii]|uniref:Uncharacterized protein n=1 Tax=Leptospira noguchii TaxID=28182 RepID=A0AAE9GFY2_9LEPT|nr:hypothetical protein [Leptospira noguchii]UOG54559.1 hypothetical protein MAL09_00755 [Leptospira noguchii]UOG58430.1 hypothetical protein MAL03_01075 [Leptospira noguchii]